MAHSFPLARQGMSTRHRRHRGAGRANLCPFVHTSMKQFGPINHAPDSASYSEWDVVGKSLRTLSYYDAEFEVVAYFEYTDSPNDARIRLPEQQSCQTLEVEIAPMLDGSNEVHVVRSFI